MKKWIEGVKKDRTITVDGKPADKYMVIVGLNNIIDNLIAEIERLEKENKPLQDFRQIMKMYKGRGVNQTSDMVIIDRQSYNEKEQQRTQFTAIAEAADDIDIAGLTSFLEKLSDIFGKNHILMNPMLEKLQQLQRFIAAWEKEKK